MRSVWPITFVFFLHFEDEPLTLQSLVRIPVNMLDYWGHGTCPLYETLHWPEIQSIFAENSLDVMKTNGSALQPQCINIKYWNSPTKGKRHVIETLSALNRGKISDLAEGLSEGICFRLPEPPPHPQPTSSSMFPVPQLIAFFEKNLYPKYLVSAAILFITLILRRWGAFSFSFALFAAA